MDRSSWIDHLGSIIVDRSFWIDHLGSIILDRSSSKPLPVRAFNIRRATNREFRRFAYKARTGAFSIPTVRVEALEYS